MNKTFQILKREFLYRIRKKSFLVMTLLGPFLFAFLLVIPAWLSLSNIPETKIIKVLNKTTGPIENHIVSDYFVVDILDSSKSFTKALTEFSTSESSLFLYISKDEPALLFTKAPITNAEEAWIKEIIREGFTRSLVEKREVDQVVAEKLIRGPELRIENLYDDRLSSPDLLIGVSILLGVITYLFILTYTIQVMKGVAEEKGSRIAEILLTSVKPFQLMMGKILGIASVSIIQFLIWVILSGSIYLLFFQKYGESLALFNNSNIHETLTVEGIDVQQALEWNAIITSFSVVDASLISAIFPFYFIFGYLLYASIFAAIGAIVDSETDTQQFVFPLTIPILICFALMQTFANDPSGDISMFFALFPLTSPVAIMMLLPFGVSSTLLILSMGILIFTFILIVWAASRIYRVGILLYGTKPAFSDVLKWVFK